MLNEPLYPNAKPIDGDALILCEGDAVAYETSLLKAWADAADLDRRFVKVLACGTADALFGMADAIGRTMPIIVIEDRDFRTLEEAKKECQKKARNREGRNVAIRAWFHWRRAEIENYFTDDAILPPVFADVFECDAQTVRDVVTSALKSLAVGQALEYSLYRARKSWLTTDANRALRVESVRWDKGVLRHLSAADVRLKLQGRLKKWQDDLHDGSSWEDPMNGEQLLSDFDNASALWSGIAYENDVWRRDWACKEVLKRVRMDLCAAKHGWWSLKSHPGAPVAWGSFPDDKSRDQHDRFIERTIQPALVHAVANRLATPPTFDLREELDALASIIRTI